MNESTLSSLRKLRLSGMAATIEARLQEAAGNGLTHEEFLELALQDELVVAGCEKARKSGCVPRFLIG